MEPSDRIRTEGDDWTKTTNPRERKKIQDRLAQRARRARLRQSDAPSSKASGSSQPPDIASVTQSADSPAFASSSTALVSTRRARSSSEDIDTDSFYLVLRCQTVIAALTSNAASIPVYCEVRVPSILDETRIRSPPSTLMPTRLQSEIPHLAFVAALPFAGLRDRILTALPHIDYEDLWKDSVSGGFFVWGSLSWSSQGWEVTEQWAKKWWFLLDQEVISTANFWRLQRGLPRLSKFGPPTSIQ